MICKSNTNVYQTIASGMKIEFILITFCYMNMLYGRLYTRMRMYTWGTQVYGKVHTYEICIPE
jgi:hypothetical protein